MVMTQVQVQQQMGLLDRQLLSVHYKLENKMTIQETVEELYARLDDIESRLEKLEAACDTMLTMLGEDDGMLEFILRAEDKRQD